MSDQQHELPQSFGPGLAAVKLLQDSFMAQVEEYDVRPGGEIEIRMSLPSDPHVRRIILRRSRVMRNEVHLRASRGLVEDAAALLSTTRAFMADVYSHLAERGALGG